MCGGSANNEPELFTADAHRHRRNAKQFRDLGHGPVEHHVGRFAVVFRNETPPHDLFIDDLHHAGQALSPLCVAARLV